MKKNNIIILAIVIVAIVIIAVVGLSRKSTQSAPGQYDTFAQCLTEKGVKMYGAYWCSHCEAQKEMFGNSWQYVDYVECASPNSKTQSAICKNAGVTSYPTWVFANGQKITGELSFEDLSQNSGCEFVKDIIEIIEN